MSIFASIERQQRPADDHIEHSRAEPFSLCLESELTLFSNKENHYKNKAIAISSSFKHFSNLENTKLKFKHFQGFQAPVRNPVF